MGVESADVGDPDVALELLARLAALLEEVGAEPDLFQVSLVRVLCQDLLDGYLALGGAVDAQPDHAETTPSQQTNPLEVFGESFSKLGVLVGC